MLRHTPKQVHRSRADGIVCARTIDASSASKALDLPKIHRKIVNSSSYSDPWFSSTMLDSDRSDLRSNSRQVVQFLLTHLLFAINKAYF